jgi:hypothetical protein
VSAGFKELSFKIPKHWQPAAKGIRGLNHIRPIFQHHNLAQTLDASLSMIANLSLNGYAKHTPKIFLAVALALDVHPEPFMVSHHLPTKHSQI